MFQPGNLIVYGNCGVCRVVSVGKLESPTVDPDRLYYTLKPVFGNEIIYIPVDSDTYMRPTISKEQAEDLVRQIPQIQEDVYVSRNLTMLKEHYEEAFHSHQCRDLVQLIKSIYSKKEKAIGEGKRIGQVDTRYMKRAEELLYGELSVALEIPRDNVLTYIETAIQRLEGGRSRA